MDFKIIFITFLFTYKSSGHHNFSYDGILGPQYWNKEFQTCKGKHQSPINIEDHDVEDVRFPSLKFVGLQEPQETTLTNNGHTVLITFKNPELIRIYGGPLDAYPYVFKQMHFHWGSDDNEGSEDRINNHAFAMELHAVFYKKTYGSMEAAVHYSDGLAVLAYFVEVDEFNESYEPLVAALPMIEEVNTNITLNAPINPEKLLLPGEIIVSNYYTYHGSLTTPPCSEVVIWIDFKDSFRLTHEQIEAFRNVKTFGKQKLTHNFRPVQSLEGRKIFNNVVISDLYDNSGETKPTSSLSITFFALLFAIPPELWFAFFGI
ncbi:carbonic anhydrase 2 [Microplitis demolitor]|uniref:carbonic anhydrase 2 n=1 Tax=Microplitis demolitor TaxID=69319 RepID=UPI0006D4D32C|nr:carbonic anhydrase 2 [Microplitis demolitor]